MTDPLEVLRQPLVPLAPDPAFAASLRDRIRRALGETEESGQPEGEQAMSASARVLTAAEGDVVYLSLQVPDAARAREFYGAVLGWRFGVSDEPGAERERSRRQVQDQALHIGIWDGAVADGVGNPGVFVVRRVADVAAAVRRVRELGGTANDPYQDEHGVMSNCLDDQGNGFTLVEIPPGEPRSPVNGEGPGDVAYLTISLPDEVRASRFYGGLFGWEFPQGSVAHGLNVGGPHPMTGIYGGAGRQPVELQFRVADVAAAVRRVRELGGTATDPDQRPYGVAADCVDNQGLVFGIVDLS
ncbi:MAG TPA: VOC family protein [Trebonia sp.]